MWERNATKNIVVISLLHLQTMSGWLWCIDKNKKARQVIE